MNIGSRGRYVLEVPATSIVIDGACENSPFDCPRSGASFANHSNKPNARLESWPVLNPGPLEVRQHIMLVASECISAGAEVRYNYEQGVKLGSCYWSGAPPTEGSWRAVRVQVPPPSNEEPIHNRYAVAPPSRHTRSHLSALSHPGNSNADDAHTAQTPFACHAGASSAPPAILTAHGPLLVCDGSHAHVYDAHTAQTPFACHAGASSAPPCSRPVDLFSSVTARAHRLRELQAAAGRRRPPPECREPQPLGGHAPIDWHGPTGGDARLRAVVPLLSSPNGGDVSNKMWPLVSTHITGRSGAECRERWFELQADEEARA
jgi:hypothetical protein